LLDISAGERGASGVALHKIEHGLHHLGQLGAHGGLAPSDAEPASCLLVRSLDGRAVEHEPFAQRAHDGVVPVDAGRAAADKPAFARPAQQHPAAGPYWAVPGAVVDLAEGGKCLATRVAVHGEDGAEVFAQDHAEVAHLP